MIDVPKHLEDVAAETAIDPQEAICGTMDRVYYQLNDGKVTDLQKFDRIAKGDVLATHDDGTTINAEADGYIVMPDPRMTKAPKNGEEPEEWFYTAVPGKLIPQGFGILYFYSAF